MRKTWVIGIIILVFIYGGLATDYRQNIKNITTNCSGTSYSACLGTNVSLCIREYPPWSGSGLCVHTLDNSVPQNPFNATTLIYLNQSNEYNRFEIGIGYNVSPQYGADKYYVRDHTGKLVGYYENDHTQKQIIIPITYQNYTMLNLTQVPTLYSGNYVAYIFAINISLVLSEVPAYNSYPIASLDWEATQVEQDSQGRCIFNFDYTYTDLEGDEIVYGQKQDTLIRTTQTLDFNNPSFGVVQPNALALSYLYTPSGTDHPGYSLSYNSTKPSFEQIQYIHPSRFYLGTFTTQYTPYVLSTSSLKGSDDYRIIVDLKESIAYPYITTHFLLPTWYRVNITYYDSSFNIVQKHRIERNGTSSNVSAFSWYFGGNNWMFMDTITPQGDPNSIVDIGFGYLINHNTETLMPASEFFNGKYWTNEIWSYNYLAQTVYANVSTPTNLTRYVEYSCDPSCGIKGLQWSGVSISSLSWDADEPSSPVVFYQPGTYYYTFIYSDDVHAQNDEYVTYSQTLRCLPAGMQSNPQGNTTLPEDFYEGQTPGGVLGLIYAFQRIGSIFTTLAGFAVFANAFWLVFVLLTWWMWRYVFPNNLTLVIGFVSGFMMLYSFVFAIGLGYIFVSLLGLTIGLLPQLRRVISSD